MDRLAISPSLDPGLALALLASAVFHAGILLGIGVLAPEPGADRGEDLHMVEYRPEHQGRPSQDSASRAASQAQEARGVDAATREALSPNPARRQRPETPLATPQQVLRPESTPRAQATPGEPVHEPAQPPEAPVLTTQEAAREVTTAKAPAGGEEGSTQPGKERPLRLYPSDRQLARWSRERQQRQVQADKDGTARQATYEDATAGYINGLISKVQRVGANNYPEEARERDLTGRVRVAAHVRPDGSLIKVEILESSGSDLLDAGARRIIRLAAPFSRFPEDVEARHPDGLPIRHYFHFTKSGTGLSPESG